MSNWIILNNGQSNVYYDQKTISGFYKGNNVLKHPLAYMGLICGNPTCLWKAGLPTHHNSLHLFHLHNYQSHHRHVMCSDTRGHFCSGTVCTVDRGTSLVQTSTKNRADCQEQ